MRARIGALCGSLAAVAGCSSFELELDVRPWPASDAEVRIDGSVPAGGVYRASFGSYEEARGAVIPIEVRRGGAVVDTWIAPVEACAWVCATNSCPEGDPDRAKLDIPIEVDATIGKYFEGTCTWDGRETIGFIP